MKCRPAIASLRVATIVGVGGLAAKTVTVAAVFLAEPFDVDGGGRGGESEDDRVTHSCG